MTTKRSKLNISRTPVTLDEVFSAAETLVANGENISVLNIHSLIGRGSYTTITRHLKIWKEQFGEDGTPKQSPISLPSDLESEGMSMLKNFWEMAVKNEQQAVERERQALAEKEVELEQRAEDILRNVDTIKAEIEHIQETLDTSQEQLAAEREVTVKLDRELAVKTAALERTEETNTELEQKITELTAKYEGKLEKVTSDLDAERKGAQQLCSEIKQQTLLLAHEKQENERTYQKLMDTEALLSSKTIENESLVKSLEKAQQRTEQLDQQYSDAMRRAKTLETNINTIEVQLKDRGKQYADAVQDKQNLEIRIATIEGQLTERTERTIQAEQKLEQALEQIALLKVQK